MERKLFTGDHWGAWYLNAERKLLEYRPNATKYRDIEEGCKYYVRLREMTSRKGFNDWVSHMMEKTWFVGSVRQGFLDAANDIFHPDDNFVNGRVLPPEYFKMRFDIMSDEEAEARQKADEADFEEEIEERRQRYSEEPDEDDDE